MSIDEIGVIATVIGTAVAILALLHQTWPEVGPRLKKTFGIKQVATNATSKPDLNLDQHAKLPNPKPSRSTIDRLALSTYISDLLYHQHKILYRRGFTLKAKSTEIKAEYHKTAKFKNEYKLLITVMIKSIVPQEDYGTKRDEIIDNKWLITVNSIHIYGELIYVTIEKEWEIENVFKREDRIIKNDFKTVSEDIIKLYLLLDLQLSDLARLKKPRNIIYWNFMFLLALIFLVILNLMLESQS